MKFRLVDLLRCPCARSHLTLKRVVTEDAVFNDSLTQVRCSKTCAFKQRAVGLGGVTPADCTLCYKYEIMQGSIGCDCGREWPIINGIPRFLPRQLAADLKKTQATFSFEWKMFRFGERNWGQNISSRKNLFLRGMGVNPEDLKGKLIFDAGCGSGVLSMEMAKSLGMEVVALDLAFGIEKAFERKDSPYVYFVQGSVLEPPFRDQTFDYLYCAGVLVHCPDTRAGFKAIVRTLKPGGRCFIWVYHPIDRTHYHNMRDKMLVYNWVRKKITSHLPINLQYLLYLSLILPFLLKQSIERLLDIRENALTWREKMQGLFDFFSPVYQNRHQSSEVMAWYSEQGFSDVKVAYTGQHGFGVRGDLPGCPVSLTKLEAG